ncbi:hypothetical protein MBLNU457_g0461t1 [Dothideomycetes sp. NU457]
MSFTSIKQDAKAIGHDAEKLGHDLKEGTKRAMTSSIPTPAFSDISKAASDRGIATLDVKLKTPNGANVNIKGKQAFDSTTTASVEGKYALKPQGTQEFLRSFRLMFQLPAPLRQKLFVSYMGKPTVSFDPHEEEPGAERLFRKQYTHVVYLTYNRPGITITQGFTTASLLDTKVEFAEFLNQPVKVELQNLFNPNAPNKGAQKVNFTFKQDKMNARAFLDRSASGGINALIDAVVGHEGFVAGAEAGYDVQKAAITRYSAAIGYHTSSWNANIIGLQNLSVVAASYYQKVNSSVEAGAKATYALQGNNAVALEVATKYKLDPLSFAKAKINDRGIAALSYNTRLNPGTTLGLGLSLDTAKLNEAGHKIGTSLTFEG